MADFGFQPQLTASGTIAPNRFVVLSGTASGAFYGAQASAATDIVVGVTDSSTRRFDNTTDNAISGDLISLQPSRLVQVAAGTAAIVVNDKLTADSSGRAIATTTTGNLYSYIAVSECGASAAGTLVWAYFVGNSKV